MLFCCRRYSFRQHRFLELLEFLDRLSVPRQQIHLISQHLQWRPQHIQKYLAMSAADRFKRGRFTMVTFQAPMPIPQRGWIPQFSNVTKTRHLAVDRL
jgi:hypothetical protein